MTRCPLLFALTTLGITACSPEAALHPLAAPAPTLAASSGRAAVAAQRAMELPFRGTMQARETAQFDPSTNSILVHLDGTGTATHLGRYTLVSDFTVSLATATAAGHVTFTAASGDMLTATFTGQGVVTGGVNAIVETATITGGTGRFAGATGGVLLERLLTTATGVSFGSLEGSITFGK